MRYHWLKQEDVRKILNIYWDKGKNNKTDYYTKHHLPSHHKSERPKYILKGHAVTKVCTEIIQSFWRGCVETVSPHVHNMHVDLY